MNFSGLELDTGIASALSEAAENSRLPHAVVLEGASAQLRVDLARRLAAACICTAEGTRPCLSCRQCKNILSGTHSDVFEYTGGDAARSFHISVIREIRSDAFIMPNEAECKFYILHNAHSMSEQAQNALLNILEEPPKNVYFILSCASKAALLPTVLSRTSVFMLGGESGSSGADSELLEAARELARRLASAALESELRLLETVAELEKNKELPRLVLPELRMIYRDAMLLKFGARPIRAEEPAATMAKKMSRDKLLNAVEKIGELEGCLSKNANRNLLLTRLCSTLV